MLPQLAGSGLKGFGRHLTIQISYTKEIVKCFGRYPIGDVLFGLRHGYAADRVFLYGRQQILSGEYLTDLQRQFTRFINPKPSRELLEDKLLFGAIFRHIARVPTNYLYSDNGRLVVVSSEEWGAIASCRDPVKSYRLVLKRARGGGGEQVQFLKMCQGVVQFTNREISLSDFCSDFTRTNEALLCEFIEQSDFCKRIYPYTTNTLRVICMRESSGKPFIARAILRVGSDRSNAVDNFGKGGLAVSVDLETGKLGEAVEHYASAPREPSIYSHHPDTGMRIAGDFLPGWQRARDHALCLMHHFPFLNYVGWDIILTESGPVLLEGNNYTGVRLAQIHRGLLCENRIRAFYQRFGIVPRDKVSVTCPSHEVSTGR